MICYTIQLNNLTQLFQKKKISALTQILVTQLPIQGSQASEYQINYYLKINFTKDCT